MEKESFDKKSLHISSYNNDSTAGSPTNNNNKNSIYCSALNNFNNNQSNYYNNSSNTSDKSIQFNTNNNNHPVYYQQLMENKIKANLGLYNSGQSNHNNHNNNSNSANSNTNHSNDTSPKNLSISSHGSMDSPSPPKNSYSLSSSHKETSPNSSTYPEFANSDHQQQKETNPTKKIKSTFPFGKCRVCNDKATGIHYGIATCEGCKGFFKRSTLKKEKYRCYFGNNCLLTPKNRNRCKACRFNKCLDVGMSIQGVKMGRIPKIEKEKALLSLKLNGKEEVNSKHRMSINANHYDEEEDEGSNEDNNEFDNDYDADDGEDELHHGASNDHEEMTRAFAKTSVLGDVSEAFGYNVQMLIAQNNRSLSANQPSTNSNVKHFEVDHHLVKKIRNNEPVLYLPQQQQALHQLQQVQQQSQHQSLASSYDRSTNEITLLENLSLNNLNTSGSCNPAKVNAESEDISQSSDTNNSESDINETRVSLRSHKYEDEIELDKELINFTPGYKHISIYELLKMHKPLRSANIIANCYHSNNSNTSCSKLDDSYQIISSLLSDKIYQIHIEHNDKVVKLQERAIRLLYQGVQEYDGHDATIKEVWEGLLESIPQVVKNLIAFAREIPGLNELSQVDFNLIINNKVFDFFILRHAPLFINGESFMMLPNNIQYTRKWMNQVIGQEMADDLFNFSTRFNKLGLTTKEMALLYPLVLTGNIYEGTFQDVVTVQNLNEYYHRALLYEFDLNLRDDDFIKRVNELISELPKLNELQAARIGSLSPQC